MMRWIADADLEEGSKELLKNMLSKELVLGCFDDAEMNDWRWKIRRKRDMFFAMHPDHRFILDAEDQQAIYDDPHATLTQLSDQQRQIVRDFFDVLEARITRAKQGFQQEMMNMDIHEERGGETEPEEQKGGLRGWLGL